MWIQLVSIAIYAVLLGLGSELLLAFRLGRFQISSDCCDALAILLLQYSIFILNYGNAIGLSTLFGILDDLDGACRVLILICPPGFTQTLLLLQSFVSCKLAKNQILIRISLVLLDEEVIGCSHGIVLIISDLLNDAFKAI